MTPFSAARIRRVVWTVLSIFVIENLVFGVSGLPAFLFWTWALSWVHKIDRSAPSPVEIG